MNGARIDPCEIATDFTTYDGRSHVLGASMVAAIDRAVRKIVPHSETLPFHIRRAKFAVKTGCNGMLRLDFSENCEADPKSAAAELTGLFGDRSISAWFRPNPNLPVKRCQPSNNDISRIEATATYAGRCHARADGLEPVLRTLVDANKRVQLAGPAFDGRKPMTELVYIEDLTIDLLLREVDTDVEIRNLANREASGRIYTLNQLSLRDSSGAERSFRLGFSFA